MILKSVNKSVNKYAGYINKFGLTPDKLACRISGKSNQIPKIFCVTVPKSGTHLLQQALLMYTPIYRYFSRVLNNANCKSLAELKSQVKHVKNGQFVLSHINFTPEIYNYLMESGFKIFFMIRDPRDIILSEAHFVVNRADHPWRKFLIDETLYERIESLIVGKYFWDIGKRLNGRKGWLTAENVKTIKFEHLVGSLGGGNDFHQQKTIQDIFEHIDLRLSNQEVINLSQSIYSKKTLTFRKGKINEWSEVFDDHLKEKFKQVAGQQLIDYGYEKDLNW